jgi:transposase-like protein
MQHKYDILSFMRQMIILKVENIVDGLIYSDNYKLSIVIEVLKENESIVKIANKHNLKPFLIKKWKLEFIDLVESTIKRKNSEITHLKNQLDKQVYYDKLSNNMLMLLK